MTLPNKKLREGEGGEPAPKKLKKTVTWAGDVPASSAEEPQDSGGGGEEGQPGRPVIVLHQPQDSLFADLDEHVLGQQVDLPVPSTAALSYGDLLQHRIDNIDRLYELYEAEMWSLYDELHLRHRKFLEEQQQQQDKEGEEEGGSWAGVPAAAAGAGQQRPHAGEGAQQQSKHVSLRQLYRQRIKGSAYPASEAGQQLQEQGGGALDAMVLASGEQQAEGGAPADGAARAAAQAQQQAAAETPVGPGQPQQTQEAGQSPRQQQQQQPDLPQAGGAAEDGCGAEPASEGLAQQGTVGQAAAPQDPSSRAQGPSAAPGKEQGLPVFEELEGLITGLGPDAAPLAREELVQQRASFLRHLGLLGRLEQSMLASLCQELDTFGAVAALCGRRQRYLLRRTAVLLGRSTESQGKVDVDLSGEGHSQTVSRQQAQLFLESDGTFRLRCLGRRSVVVNGRQVCAGGCVPLPHLSLVKVGGVSLLFLANHAAVQRVMRRSAALSV